MPTKALRTATPAKAAATPSKTPAKTNTKPRAKPSAPTKVLAIAAKPAKSSSVRISAVKRRIPARPAVSPVAAPVPSQSKQARLIALLRSPKGSTIEQMKALTGWQAHTVRGTISGVMRKRLGLNVSCAASDGTRFYRIVEAVAA